MHFLHNNLPFRLNIKIELYISLSALAFSMFVLMRVSLNVSALNSKRRSLIENNGKKAAETKQNESDRRVEEEWVGCGKGKPKVDGMNGVGQVSKHS